VSWSLKTIDLFNRQAKRLARKYPSLAGDLLNLEQILIANPLSGTSVGPNVYKIRLAIRSKGRGKSGGARVITYVITEDREVWLLSIYDKAERENIADAEMAQLVASVLDARDKAQT
jgi:hypothetical protein